MMQRCLVLARQAWGQTAPNPLVGCVIVKEGQIVGEGYHPQAGQPHAEVFALRAAGADDPERNRANGATLYVNLEPCNHYGRTPPCSEAVIKAGIAKVVVGMIDPDPRVAGSGVARLREAGIDVAVGIEEADCRELNEGFIQRVLHQRPLGILKYAMTLDGKIATSSGHSAWVTAPSARTAVHQLRATCDAVIVGGNTVRRDNPQLTTHQSDRHNPLRIVMSKSLDLPPDAYLWQTQTAPTLVLTEAGCSSPLLPKLQAMGVEVVTLEHLSPASVMAYLYQRGLAVVLWECGGRLAARAIAEGVIQKVWAFIAPKIIGGEAAPSPVGELGFTSMTEALTLERVRWRAIGDDCLVEGYLPERSELAYPGAVD
jgi:diaminohydroxyphosphoribosylaminopyrimidine deaminase / 5-amino-6-(5-phosphoribosylamino)uracil reductase